MTFRTPAPQPLPYQPAARDDCAEVEAVRYEKRWKHPSGPGKVAPWLACSSIEATSHFERSPNHEYRALYSQATIDTLTADRDRLKARVEELEKALEFYADPKNYLDTPPWDGDPECITERAIPFVNEEGISVCDCGDAARQALKGEHA